MKTLTIVASKEISNDNGTFYSNKVQTGVIKKFGVEIAKFAYFNTSERAELTSEQFEDDEFEIITTEDGFNRIIFK